MQEEAEGQCWVIHQLPRDVIYGVPQFSLLGPSVSIFLILDLPVWLGVEEANGVTMYADDCCVWTAQGNPEVLKARLEVLSCRMIQYALKIPYP